VDQVLSVVTDDLPVVAQQVKQVQAAEKAVSMARGQYSPTVDFTSARQLNLSGVAPYKQDTFSQVQVNMPLYSGGSTSAAVDAAVGQLKAAQYALDEARLIAREKATVAYHEWQSAQGRSTQGASQAKVGDKVVDGYRQQFRLGRRQLLDLLNIQAEAFGYQSTATTAFYDEQVARARLLAVTGDLAKRF
jgi:adhesin transport system outer membrane protein